MADYASIARPYAKAIFELAKESKSYADWTNVLSNAATATEDEDFQALIADPKVNKEKLTDLLVEISGDMPEGGLNFFKLIVQNDRILALPEVTANYKELVAKINESVEAEVITAMALTDSQKKALSDSLESKLGLKVSLLETVDPDLIGGAVVKAGDLVIDGSAKGRIEKLATTLAR